MRVLLMMCLLAGSGCGVTPASAIATDDRYSVTPEEHAACDADAEKLCFDAFPDQEKLLSCMKAKRTELTPVCLASIKAGLARRHMRPM